MSDLTAAAGGVRDLHLHRPVSPAGPRTVAVAGGGRHVAIDAGLHPGLPGGSRNLSASSTGEPDGWWAGHRGDRLRRANWGRHQLRAHSPHHRVNHLLCGNFAGRHPGYRPHRWECPGRTCRRCLGDLGDQLGARRALGIAIFGSIGTAIYRMAKWDAVPGGLPPEALDAARSTLGGAVSVAGQLPSQLGAQLLGSAREAFIRAFQLTAAISAVVALVTAIGLFQVFMR